MKVPEYTVAVRTVGYGGAKYESLLKSISCLNPKPREVLICLPEGASLPKMQLGFERFIFLPRGMMSQRIYAIDEIQTDYVLFTDDDIKFTENFVTKLHHAIDSGYDIAVGECLDALPAKKGIKHLLPIIHAAGVPTLFHKDRYVTVLRSTGYSYNRFTPHEGLILPTQSAIGCMFYTSCKAMRQLHFEDELWAQHDAIAPAEDQIMFYKAYRVGLKTGCVTDAHFEHLDAKSATKSKENKVKKKYYSEFNRVVFWRRFIYDFEKNQLGRYASRIMFAYYRCFSKLVQRLQASIKRYSTDIKNNIGGVCRRLEVYSV